MRRLLTAEEMNRLSDLDERPDIARAAGEDSEMVDGGYLADFTPSQMAYLATRYLPTGEPAAAFDEPSAKNATASAPTRPSDPAGGETARFTTEEP